jgi:hypothetical protein
VTYRRADSNDFWQGVVRVPSVASGNSLEIKEMREWSGCRVRIARSTRAPARSAVINGEARLLCFILLQPACEA